MKNKEYFAEERFENLDPQIKRELKDYYDYLSTKHKEEWNVYEEYYNQQINKI